MFTTIWWIKTPHNVETYSASAILTCQSAADRRHVGLSILLTRSSNSLTEQFRRRCVCVEFWYSVFCCVICRLTLGKLLGEGAFGSVVKAQAVGIAGRSEVSAVAVKMLKGLSLFFSTHSLEMPLFCYVFHDTPYQSNSSWFSFET